MSLAEQMMEEKEEQQVERQERERLAQVWAKQQEETEKEPA
jgi:hypothetical protein